MRNQYMDSYVALQHQVNTLIAIQKCQFRLDIEQERIDLEEVEMRLFEKIKGRQYLN